MGNSFSALNERGLRTAVVTAGIRMAWVALRFALGLFSIAFFAFLAALFLSRGAASTSILGS
jgi:hypothetical protein